MRRFRSGLLLHQGEDDNRLRNSESIPLSGSYDDIAKAPTHPYSDMKRDSPSLFQGCVLTLAIGIFTIFGLGILIGTLAAIAHRTAQAILG